MTVYSRQQLTAKSYPIVDSFLKETQLRWSNGAWPAHNPKEFLPLGVEWFKSTKLNTIYGWDDFTCEDVIMGCTHYIESLIIKFGWDGFQILRPEYAYYGLMGKHGVEPGNLQPNTPLIVSLPNYHYAGLRPDWQDIIRECESKNIDIHIDMAWITAARNIEIDVSHPCVKSFAMSMSKYNLHWNRVGIRWCRQRTMDSITMFNHYYEDVNSAITTCGAYMVKNIPRDYLWDTYASEHHNLCQQLNLETTNIIHVALDGPMNPVGIGRALSENR